MILSWIYSYVDQIFSHTSYYKYILTLFEDSLTESLSCHASI